MKKYTVLVLGITLILSGILFMFYESFALEVDETKENEKQIEEKYESMKGLLNEINDSRGNIYNLVINDLYIEKVESSYSTWYQTYQSYKMVIDKMEEYKSELNRRCFNILYQDSNIQSKCDSMMLSYETAINYYVKDVGKFNDFIANYNVGKEETEYKQVIDLGSYNYIDFNDDGRYTGK